MNEPGVELGTPLTSHVFEQFQKDAPPNFLYHYTDQSGLLGIIQSAELWATKVQYMNDSTEFTRAVEIAKKRALERIGDLPVLEPSAPFPWIIEALDNIPHVNVCSVSFCSDADLLSQWRGYSSSGVGYAIGFHSTALVEMARGHDCRLGRCIYEEATQIEIIDELINRITHQYASHRDSHPNVLKTSLGKVFADAVIGLGAFFKDGAFREEDEWRLVTSVKSYRDTFFRFRTGKSMLIPYYSLKVGNGSWRDKIASVTIGPCPHPEISQMAVSGLLVSQYVTTEVWLTSPTPTHSPVNISKIPYRSW